MTENGNAVRSSALRVVYAAVVILTRFARLHTAFVGPLEMPRKVHGPLVAVRVPHPEAG